jgi:HEAT repeat protein
MPLVKRQDTQAAPSTQADVDEAFEAHLIGLVSPEADCRWRAARVLGGKREAVPALAAALAQERVPHVRQAIVTALMRVADEASVLVLLHYIRSQDARERSASLDALQALPEAVAPFAALLLADSDADVRILATELVRNMPQSEATSLLCGVLEREEDANVSAAAIEVLAEVGTPEAFPALRRCAARFAATPFLPFAAATAIAQIQAMKD